VLRKHRCAAVVVLVLSAVACADNFNVLSADNCGVNPNCGCIGAGCSCSNPATSCDATCHGGSCDVTCSQPEGCSLTCGAGAACSLACNSPIDAAVGPNGTRAPCKLTCPNGFSPCFNGDKGKYGCVPAGKCPE
jgi:hypothetical protein